MGLLVQKFILLLRALCRRWRWAMLVSVLATAGAFGAYLVALQITGNFHEVIPGELYRSAQPSESQLRDYIREYGIKTVLNLRGPSDRQWYRQEVETTRNLGAVHLDYAMSSGRRLSVEQMTDIAALMRDAQKPLLIHCSHGADRSSLVSAIYLKEVALRDEDEAEEQMSVYFGHVAIPYFSRSYAMDESWETLQAVPRHAPPRSIAFRERSLDPYSRRSQFFLRLQAVLRQHSM